MSLLCTPERPSIQPLIDAQARGPFPLQQSDFAEMGRFLKILDPDPAARWDFRAIHDKGAGPTIMLHGDLNRSIRISKDPAKHGKSHDTRRTLNWAQSAGCGLFVVVNRCNGRGQSDENIVGVRAYHTDLDTAAAIQRFARFVKASGLSPTLLVASGGLDGTTEKLHAHWAVKDGSVADFPEDQKLLISRIGSDPSVHNRSRVLRLAGSRHLKKDPRRVRIIAANSQALYRRTEFLARVNQQPQIANPWASGHSCATTTAAVVRHPRSTVPVTGPNARLRILLDSTGGLITPAVHALLREGVPPTDGAAGNRHATLLTVVGRCVQVGWPDGDIQTLVLPIINHEWGDGDWGEHLDSILTWTREQHAKEIAAIPAAPSSIAVAFGSAGAR